MTRWLLIVSLMGVLNVNVTGYRGVVGEGGPVAANGECITPGRTCAVSPDLKHLYGKWIHISGIGVRYVHDKTARHLRGVVDVAVRTKREASEITKRGVNIKIIGAH